MIRTGVIILLCLMIRGLAVAQQKVLVFSDPLSGLASVDQLAVNVLGDNAPKHNFNLTFSTSPLDFTADNLKNYNGVLFLNTGVNGLDFRQSAELMRFFRLGGGFLGIHKAAQPSYNWIWYQKMINATLKKEQLSTPASYDIITNAFIGKIMLSPLWKLKDQPLLFENTGTDVKPVLLDLNGRVGSWYGTTSLGNKAFYTSFGGTEDAFSNQVFIDHIFAGLQEVCSPSLPDYGELASDVIPDDKKFAIVREIEQLDNALALKVTNTGNIYILQGGGKLLCYDKDLKKLKDLGSFPLLEKSIDFSFDPEFGTNGYIYFYNPPKEGLVPIIRLKTTGNKLFEVAEFGTQSAMNARNTATYHPELFESSRFRLPVYYRNKTFKYDEYKGLQVETKGAGSEVLNVEPFLSTAKFGVIKDMDIGVNGELYVLENDALKKVLYAEDGSFPPVAKAVSDPVKGNVPLKVNFTAEGSYDLRDLPLTYKWNFTEKDSSAVSAPVFIFKKPGTVKVKLEVSNAVGLKDQIWLEVEAEALKKKK